MVKIQFEILDKVVDSLYEKNIDEKDLEKIDAQCNFIAEVIRASGWTEEEYLRRLFGFDMSN